MEALKSVWNYLFPPKKPVGPPEIYRCPEPDCDWYVTWRGKGPEARAAQRLITQHNLEVHGGT